MVLKLDTVAKRALDIAPMATMAIKKKHDLLPVAAYNFSAPFLIFDQYIATRWRCQGS
ncbi:hypothetical protein O9992_16585 [Vibrio lentus]|nr:hypothetical protein [Vibrio lentus]